MKFGAIVVVVLVLSAFAAHFLLGDPGYVAITFRGYLVEMSDGDPGWGDYDLRKEIASAVKPFYAHFLFHAVEQGLGVGVA